MNKFTTRVVSRKTDEILYKSTWSHESIIFSNGCKSILLFLPKMSGNGIYKDNKTKIFAKQKKCIKGLQMEQKRNC